MKTKKRQPKVLKNGCYSLLKEDSIRLIAHSAPVEENGTTAPQQFAINRSYIDALNTLVLDIFAHCLSVAANENRRTLTAADVPTFTELMKHEMEEMQRAEDER